MPLPQRKSPRLREYDYSNSGYYFITICTQNRQCFLSSIVGEGSPLPHLSKYGTIADFWIRKIPRQYPMFSVDRYVIMPNHIHLLLIANGRGDPSPTVGTMIGWLKFHITKDINQLRGTVGNKVFQRSFHDHIIRNQKDYDAISRYIENNALAWQNDCFFSST